MAATSLRTSAFTAALLLLPGPLLLQKLADIWAYPDYINAAAAAQDPLERMKLLVTWMVAGEAKQGPEVNYLASRCSCCCTWEGKSSGSRAVSCQELTCCYVGLA
jgi:hypothetical protein